MNTIKQDHLDMGEEMLDQQIDKIKLAKLHISKNLDVIIDILTYLNSEYRKLINPEWRTVISPENYAIEFCTVAVDIGRQTGKSTYIRNHADANSLIITLNERTAKSEFGNRFNAFSGRHILNDTKSDWKKFTTIFIDEPTFVFRVAPKIELYERICNINTEQTFILLGI
jgi:hypothetical protein